MDLVTILRDLWRLRRYVVVVLLLAVVAAAGIKFTQPSYSIGIASAQILVDTPSSQVVAVSPKGSDSTAARADLLASIMVDGQVKADIAQRAGIRPAQLIGITTAATDPTGAAVTPPSGSQAYVLNTQVLTNSTGDELPIIEVDTQAPTREQAAKLASAAISGLGAYLNSKAALEKIADADRLQVSGIGLPQSTVQTKGTSPVIVVLVFVFILLAGCGAILGVRALVRGWRAASLREEMGDQGLPAWELAPDEAFEPYEKPIVRDRFGLRAGLAIERRREQPRSAPERTRPTVHEGGQDEVAGDSAQVVDEIADDSEQLVDDSEQVVSPPPQDWLARVAESLGTAGPDAAGGHHRSPLAMRRPAFGRRDDRASEHEVA